MLPFSGLISCGRGSDYSIFITVLIDNARRLDSGAVFSIVLVIPTHRVPKATGPASLYRQLCSEVYQMR